MNIIYFDNAATSWPKPKETIKAINNFFNSIGASPGRSGHRLSIDAGRIITDTRELLAKLFGVQNPFQIIFTKNATEALNIAIFGLLKPGDHIICSSMEHNSVMRPLRSLEEIGIEISIIRCSGTGELDPQEMIPLIRNNTKAVYLTHASNVTGTIMPIKEIGKISRDYGLILCIDAAQTAGLVPIDANMMNIDLLAFTGHKSLFGPQGTGGLYIREGIEKQIDPIALGGTGSRSEYEEQPDILPDKFESGTLNAIGIAGLGAGLNYIISQGVDKIKLKEEKLTSLFIDGLSSIKGAVIYGNKNIKKRTSTIAFNIVGINPSEIALEFDEEYNIMSRPGLHCAPSAHKTIGTFPVGTNRFSFGFFNTEEQINIALKAIDKINIRFK